MKVTATQLRKIIIEEYIKEEGFVEVDQAEIEKLLRQIQGDKYHHQRVMFGMAQIQRYQLQYYSHLPKKRGMKLALDMEYLHYHHYDCVANMQR